MGYCELYSWEKIALGSPSMTYDSRQNVFFPAVEGCVVSAWFGSNGPIRVEHETTLRAAFGVGSVTSISGKPKRRTLSQIFLPSYVFRPPWNLLGFMELLVLLRFGTFPFEEKAICGVRSGQQSMECAAFSFFEKERQPFRISSLNGVRIDLKSAQETSRQHISLTGWNFLIYWSAITNFKIIRELGRGENDVNDSLV